MSEATPDLTEGGKKPWFRRERRKKQFVERLSIVLVIGAFLGGFIVLLDIRFVLTIYGQVIAIGKEGFSPEVKGVVLQSMLITGFAAVVGFWLGTTKQGQEQAQSVSRMAESVAPTAAAAVAAATGQPAPVGAASATATAENMQVTAEKVEVTEQPAAAPASALLCPNCQAPQEPGVKFCNKCGTPQPKDGTVEK